MARKIGPQQSLDIEKLEAEQGDIWGSDVTRESFIEMVREVIKETQERQAEVDPSQFLILPEVHVHIVHRIAPRTPLHSMLVLDK
jgi:hypothetical protein